MLYGLLVTLFVVFNMFLILLILIQQSKSSMGFGAMGGGAQMLFGGSGGQDLFQKITWGLGAFFMFASFTLTLLKSQDMKTSRYLTGATSAIQRKIPAQEAAQEPVQTPSATE